MKKLRQDGNNYFITSQKPFASLFNLNEFSELVFDFSYGMTFGHAGEHRDHRTGGNIRRKNGELFTNTFQGKLAEFGLYKYLRGKEIETAEPDTEQWELGRWDTADLKINNSKINIKSAAFFSNLLLLEKGDWDAQGRYIPNAGTGNDLYDYFILCRIKPDLKGVMSAEKLFYSNEVERGRLREIISSNNWDFDIAGFITKDVLTELIYESYILPQGSMLNGKTRMDAANYYCQAGDMEEIIEIIPLLLPHEN